MKKMEKTKRKIRGGDDSVLIEDTVKSRRRQIGSKESAWRGERKRGGRV